MLGSSDDDTDVMILIKRVILIDSNINNMIMIVTNINNFK